MALSCPKSTYKVIAVLLIVCLLFATLPAPQASAVAVVDDIAIIGTGVVAIIAAAMGISANTHGDFKTACRACWDNLPSSLQTLVSQSVVIEGSSLILTALVAAPAFRDLWNAVKEFFSGDIIDIPAVSDIAQHFPSSVNQDNIPVGNSNGAISLPADVNYLPNANASYDFTLSNGKILSFRSEYQSYYASGTSRFKWYVNDVFINGYGSNYPSFICPFKIGNSLYIGLFTNNNFMFQPGNLVEPKYYGRVSELDWGEDINIEINKDDFVIPDDAVYNAWVDKASSAGGISLNEDSLTWQEVFGDIADDVAQIADQVQALTDTAVLEAVDEAYYTDPADVSVPRLPFLPSDFSGFGSIWHYVEEWLSSIGGFISLILNVWSSLPYIIVVPVYACVVLVLIFGVYRKFIA